MKNMNNNLKEKLIDKLGNTIINMGEKSTRDCVIFGIYEPEISIELLKSTMK